MTTSLITAGLTTVEKNMEAVHMLQFLQIVLDVMQNKTVPSLMFDNF